MSMTMDDMGFEVFKLFAGPLVTVGLAWIAGNRISANWSHRQKHREYSLAVVAEFYRVYGDFFALWKMCNYTFRDSKSDPTPEFIQGLLDRATALEARVEALLLRVASEVTLEKDDERTLGLYRQGVQLLSQSIVKRRILGWISSDHPEYKAFKVLSVAVGKLMAKVGAEQAPILDRAQKQMAAITSNIWSKEWLREFAKKPETNQTNDAKLDQAA